jgi:5-(carboxyamino)imidazole ribonucleotide mutase
MPRGVPVACVAIDGVQNAGLLALEILGLKDKQIAERLRDYRAKL